MATSPRPADLEEQLADLNDAPEDVLGQLASKYSHLKQLQEEVNRAVGAASRSLLEALEQQGLTSVNAGPVRVGITTRRGMGIAEGDDEERYLANTEKVRTFVTKYNPTQTSTTQASIKQAYEAYLVAEGSDAPLPKFLRETEAQSLSIRRS